MIAPTVQIGPQAHRHAGMLASAGNATMQRLSGWPVNAPVHHRRWSYHHGPCVLHTTVRNPSPRKRRHSPDAGLLPLCAGRRPEVRLCLLRPAGAEAGAKPGPVRRAPRPALLHRSAASRCADQRKQPLTGAAPAAPPAARWRPPAAWRPALLPRAGFRPLAGRRRRRRRRRHRALPRSAAAAAPWAAYCWSLIAVGARWERRRCLQRAWKGQLPPGVRPAWIGGLWADG